MNNRSASSVPFRLIVLHRAPPPMAFVTSYPALMMSSKSEPETTEVLELGVTTADA